jgi:hypothetical protein
LKPREMPTTSVQVTEGWKRVVRRCEKEGGRAHGKKRLEKRKDYVYIARFIVFTLVDATLER